MTEFVVICRDDDTWNGMPGPYRLASKRRFNTVLEAQDLMRTINSKREPRVAPYPAILSRVKGILASDKLQG